MARRLILQEWILQLGRDPARQPDLHFPEDGRESGETARSRAVRAAVRQALEKLTDREREFIEFYHFQGLSYAEISARTGRSIHSLESLYRRAIRRLRKELTPFVRAAFGPEAVPGPVGSARGDRRRTCPICRSTFRRDIDKLIARRDRTATWRPVMQAIRERFGIAIRSPQTLIGHEKYHVSDTPE